ncbi:hypothetical protein E8E14_000689 [Neopestalotiopsis sp. 37M]|nr:hypothetical protein E8E14_000689 [Neopestalotiopsis sp. 37M]
MDLEIATASDRHSAKATDSASDIALVEATGSNDEYNSLNETGPVYLSGWHFWLMSAAIATMLFLTNLEVPVVTTAVITIADELGGFDNAGWVLASYLLGYVAQTMTQLIIFRAFQGVGGGGCFSLCTIMMMELVPPEGYAQFVANISLSVALGLLLGPILGGAISSHSSWRWIFILNVPIAVPTFVIAWIAIPKDFPHHGRGRGEKTSRPPLRQSMHRLDIPGTALIFFATLALTSAFEEADKTFPWNSAYVIALLAGSAVMWIVLVLWERHVTLANATREPILPWTFLESRQMMGILMNFIFLGGPTIVSMFIIPQRFQLSYGSSGFEAGVRLIPFTLALPAGSIFASRLAGKLKVPPLFLLLGGSCLQILGFALLGTLDFTLEAPARIYGYQILSGWGCGMNFSLLFVLIPFVIDGKYLAVGMGAGAQFRMIGSAMILAVSTSVFNSYAREHLQAYTGLSDVGAAIGSHMASLPPDVQVEIRRVLSEAFNHQTLVLCASSVLQIPCSLMMWKKKQLVI